MKRQISSIVTTHIPQTVRSTTLIMFLLMYSGGLALRNHYRRRSCSQLGSHCPWNMLRYFISISSYLDVKVWHIFTRRLQKKLILSACSSVFLQFFSPSRLTATSLILNRYWRRILTGRMCNGHKLVFG
jgi:hypothetical protein